MMTARHQRRHARINYLSGFQSNRFSGYSSTTALIAATIDWFHERLLVLPKNQQTYSRDLKIKTRGR